MNGNDAVRGDAVESDLRAAVGQTLRKVREIHGLSIRGLAAKSGVSARTIVSLEQGQVDSTLRTLTKLASALDTTCQVLLTPAERINEEPEWHRAIWEYIGRLAVNAVDLEARVERLEAAARVTPNPRSFVAEPDLAHKKTGSDVKSAAAPHAVPSEEEEG